MHFQNYFLSYTVVPLLLLTIATSYYRFVIIEDYAVAYEGECDPYTQTCFVGCEDETCAEEYYYSYVERRATAVSELCGDTIEGCDEANFCGVGENRCSVTFCDPDTDIGCEVLTERDIPYEAPEGEYEALSENL